MNAPNNRTLHRFALTLLVFCAVFFTFFQVRHFEFLNFDDPEYVTSNAVLHGGITAQSLRWAFLAPHSGHYHPITWLSHALDCQLFGLEPGAHHLTSVFVHAMNAALLFLLLARIPLLGRNGFGISLFCALIFGLHPMRLESVAWVSERKDVLSVFFALLSLHSYLLFSTTRSTLSLVATAGFFVLGLLSKPMLVSLPFLFLLLDFWPLRRFGVDAMLSSKFRRCVVEKTPFVIISVVFSIGAVYAQHASGGLRTVAEVALSDRVSVALTSLLTYAGKLFWPSGLGIFYPMQTLAPGIGAGAALGLIAITAIAYRARHDRPYLIFGWLWFLISLFPVSGIVPIGGQLFADRWTYLPHIGLIIASACWGVEVLSGAQNRLRLVSFAAVLVVASLFITMQNLPNWRDSEAIFRHTLQVSPENFMAHSNLSVALLKRNELVESAKHAEEAVRLNPTYPEALNNLGIARGTQGKSREALELFTRALAVRPAFVAARYNLGLTYSNMGDDLSALAEWLQAALNDPSYTDTFRSIDFTLRRRLPTDCAPLLENIATKPKTSVEKFSVQFEKLSSSGLKLPFSERLAAVYGCIRGNQDAHFVP